jgi:hypothetical protein
VEAGDQLVAEGGDGARADGGNGEMIRSAARFCLPLALLAAMTAAVACDPVEGITWVNDTDQTLSVFLTDDPAGSRRVIQPHSSRELALAEPRWNDLVVIRDEYGKVLARRELTWEELRGQGFRFVITPEMIAPVPSPTPSPSPGAS